MESITDLRRSFFRSRSLLLLLILLVIPLTSFHVFPPIDLAPVTLWSDKASHGPSLSFSLFISVTIFARASPECSDAFLEVRDSLFIEISIANFQLGEPVREERDWAERLPLAPFRVYPTNCPFGTVPRRGGNLPFPCGTSQING